MAVLGKWMSGIREGRAMGVDRRMGEHMGLFVPDEGMDASIGSSASIGRRYTKVAADQKGGAVYVMSTVGGPFAKIGWVKHRNKVEDRRDLIQVGCPYQLQIVATLEVESRRAETVLHKAFVDQHFRGEWFRREGRLLRFIQVTAAYPELSIEDVLEETS